MHKQIFEEKKTEPYVGCSFINFYLNKLKTMMRNYEQHFKKDLKIGMMSRVVTPLKYSSCGSHKLQ